MKKNKSAFRLAGVFVISLAIAGWGSFRLPGVIGIEPAHADVFSVGRAGLYDIVTVQKAPGTSLININEVEFNGFRLPITAVQSNTSPGVIIKTMKNRIGKDFHGVSTGRNTCWGGYFKDNSLSLLLAMRQPGTESSVMYSCELDAERFVRFLERQAYRQPTSLADDVDWFQTEPMSRCLDRLVLGKNPTSCVLYHCRTTQSIHSLRQWYIGAGKKEGWQARSLRDNPEFLMLTKEGKECYFSFKNDLSGYTTYTLLTIE